MNVPHDSNQQMHRYEKNILQYNDQGCELKGGRINTHHPQSSTVHKVKYVLHINYMKNGII